METVVERYKTLGAWVPRWVAGPCHNRECEAYVPRGEAEKAGGSAAGNAGEERGETPAP